MRKFAYLDAFHNQRDRRNLTEAELVRAMAVLDKRKEKHTERNETGAFTPKAPSGAPGETPRKSSESTASILGISPRKVERTRT